MSGTRRVGFGRITMAGEPLAPGGSWVLAEHHGEELVSFIVLDRQEATKLRDQMNEELDQDE
jgi:hypothetical protein